MNKKLNKQINLSMPAIWIEQLERLARNRSVEEDHTISYLDLIREALKETYSLTEQA